MPNTTLPLLNAASAVGDDDIFLARISGDTVDKKVSADLIKAYCNADLPATYQPLDSDLTAIAALTTTTFGRSLLTQADAAAARTTIGAQPLDSDLTAIAALTTTSYGRDLLTQADAAALRSTAGLGTMATQNASGVAITGGSITGLSAPTNGSDAATKDYVDALTAGMSQKNAVQVATTAALTASYSNGSSGVGATLTNSGVQAALSIDGVSLALNARVLVKDQPSTEQNGIYRVTTVGSGASNWVLTRAVDYDTPSEISEGSYTIAEEGTVNAGTLWIETGSGPFTIGTTPITFTQLVVAPQTKTFTGDVTGTGTSSIALTIAANAVTYAKIQDVSATDRVLGRSTAGAGDIEEIVFTSQARALADDTSFSAMRTTLGLAIGSDVQAYNANLAQLAGLSLVADRLPYADGTGTLALTTFTAFGRSLVDDADAAAGRATLGAVGLTGNESIAGDKTFTGTTDVQGLTRGGVPIGVSWGSINGFLASSIAGTNTTASLTISAGQATDTTNIIPITKATTTSWAVSNGNAANGYQGGSTLPNSTTIHFFMIYGVNGTASFAAATLTPTLPSGYTYYRRVFSLKTTGAGALPSLAAMLEVEGGTILCYLTTQVTDINSSTQGTTRILYTLSVPADIKVQPIGRGGGGNGSNVLLLLSGDETDVLPPNSVSSAPAFDGSSVSGNTQLSQPFLTTNTSGQIGARASGSNTPCFYHTRGWRDWRR